MVLNGKENKDYLSENFKITDTRSVSA